MPRAVVLGVALSVLATACALVEAPPPPGTVMTRAQVTNTDPFPVELAVKTRTGVLAGAAQPSSLAANATAQVIFYVPLSADWWITVNGTEMFPAEDVMQVGRQPCSTFTMTVSVSGAGSLGCIGRP